MHMGRKAIEKDEIRLFLLSFLILFFELICIRWISSTIRYIGFFNNLILLAAFLGIGIGCIIQKRKRDYITYFPILFFTFIIIISSGIITNNIESRGLGKVNEFVKITSFGQIIVDSTIMIILIFLIVALMFTSISQEFGRLFVKFKPLRAYSINIFGSLSGILGFSLISYFSIGPGFWFLSFFIIFLIIYYPERRNNNFLINFAIFIPITFAFIYLISYGTQETYWSPYYRIDKTDNVITVNGIGHQSMLTPKEVENGIQYLPYPLFEKKFNDVLIIGAGSGTDTAVSLFFNSSNVDAVDIDPLIMELGKRFHPSQPYSDPRVTIHTTDGRAFLKNTNKKYDLIVFGLTDSLTALSTYGNVRLESYLYTTDSFLDVKNRLKDDGLFMTGNRYPGSWYADKLVTMLEESFEQEPYVIFNENNRNIITLSGPRREELGPSPYKSKTKVTPSTDNWPFFYINKPSIPKIYLNALISVFVLSVIILYFAIPSSGLKSFNLHFFFLGVAFMLLETKSIVNFSLIFGATWMVNSFVFFSILLMVLLAIWFVEKHEIKQIKYWYFCLFFMLFLQLTIPLKFFISSNFIVKYMATSGFLFFPIFLANVIFSNSFKDSEQSEMDFASNILGAVFGGITEYISLLTGYKFLVVLVGCFYFLAFYRRKR